MKSHLNLFRLRLGRFYQARWGVVAVLVLGLWLLLATTVYAQEPGGVSPDYRTLPFISSRLAIWIAAQLHLMFAAFVLGVPIFAVIVEIIAWRTKDPKYDRLAHEFIRLLTVALATTAALGGLFLFLLTILYPNFFSYLTSIFGPTMIIYPLLFFGEFFTLYIYYNSWERMQNRKGRHILIGVLLNLFGTVLMFLANSWATFAISPAGIDEAGKLVSLWDAISNPTWMPLNIHRLIANVSFGGAIVGLYAAFRFLGAKTNEERAHYDWMGYVGNFIAISAFIVLPFAGYYFGREIYGYNQQMGITMMGGFLSWLWVVQALLIGVLFLTANYYLWVGMGRIPGGERYKKFTKYLLVVLLLGFLVWVTPHSLVASLEEARRIGSANHPLLGVLGVMSAKNTAVNIMILTTFVSFMLYRRANKTATVNWYRTGQLVQGGILAVTVGVVIFLGIYGYFVPSVTRIWFSVYQVLMVLFAIITGTLIDIFLFRGARSLGKIAWGKMPPRSQYALLVSAITFTWLMGLMGYARSAIRQDWHVFGVMRDTSPDAFSPTLGYVANVVSLCVILFVILIAFIFWITGLQRQRSEAGEEAPVLAAATSESTETGLRDDASEEKEATQPHPSIWSSKIVVILIFLLVIGGYTYFANSIPQIESRPAPEVAVSAAMSPQALAEAGRRIVEEKAGCLVCHGLGSAGARAPDLAGVGALAATRRPGLSAEEYLRESLLQPSEFVVAGYSAIMPPVDKPPVALSQDEITAVIAFLQSLGGQITVLPPTGGIPQEPPVSAPPQIEAGMMPTIIQKGGCGLCHNIPGIENAVGVVGPDLSDVGNRSSQEEIRQDILEPDALISPGYPAGVMPKDFGQKLSPEELDALVKFLSTLRGQ